MKEGWNSKPVREALDLCLACKGCRTECPMNVDMATYKAEFLSHYYEWRPRPRHAYAMGWIYWWARLASIAPGLANAIAGCTGVVLRSSFWAALRASGRCPVRSRDVQGVVRRKRPNPDGGPRVLLWPDTFNNHFHPQTAIAAVEVLEAAGFQVVVPRRSLCCGRPLYDFGMLKTAKKLLRADPRRAAPGNRGRDAIRGAGAKLRGRLS